MLKILRSLIPRAVLEKEKSASVSCGTFSKVDSNAANKAAEWWQNDSYTQVKRFRTIKWLGFTVWQRPYKETITGNYLRPAKELMNVFKSLWESDIIPSISEKSVIFEPGCNVGSNLIALQDYSGCKVVGMDISREAMETANKLWYSRTSHEFKLGNVLTTDFFRQLPDNYFDLCITKWHLIHIPFSEDKNKYIESLKRISKTLVIFEPIKESRDSSDRVELSNQGKFCLSWDSWASDYGLTEYKPARQMFKDNTRVYFNNK